MANVLERGELFLFYRPRVDTPNVQGPDDVARMYLVMRPRDTTVLRRIIIGRKRLPQGGSREREWAFVDRVETDPDAILAELTAIRYDTPTGGARELPAAIPAAEANYAIVEHDGHRHLAYSIEVPAEPTELQRALHIAREASYIVSVRNPRAVSKLPHSPPRPRYPSGLQARFHRRRFAPLEPELLDFEGTELVLTAACADDRELGVSFDAQHESLAEAAMFRDLHADAGEHPIAPLVLPRAAANA